jgi:hypothetical protein
MIVGKHNAVEEETALLCLPCSGTARTEGGDEGAERGIDSLGENF